MSSKPIRMRTNVQASAARAGRTAAVLLGMGFGAGLVWLVTTDSASSASGASVGLGVGVGFGVALTVLAASAALVAVSDTVRAVVAALLALLGAAVPRPPAERIDLPATITQRRPDAPGRPQPRAPGLLLAIA